MPTPFFSVIVPTFNRADFLHVAIQSVIQQTFTDWELLIVDDGSTDNTKEVVANFKDARVTYFYQENKERSAARNKGIELSNGKYICFLDSDDYFKSNRLTNLYYEIEKRNFPIALFYTGIAFQTNDTCIEKQYPSESDIYERIINDIIGTPQVCIHKHILLKYQFNVKYNLAEDLDLWTRIALKYDFIYIKSLSVVAVEHNSRSINSSENHFLKSLEVIKNVLNNNDIRSHIKKSTRQKSISNIYFKIGLFNIENKNKIKAIAYFFKSVFVNPFNNRTKHIAILIFKLFFNFK